MDDEEDNDNTTHQSVTTDGQWGLWIRMFSKLLAFDGVISNLMYNHQIELFSISIHLNT